MLAQYNVMPTGGKCNIIVIIHEERIIQTQPGYVAAAHRFVIQSIIQLGKILLGALVGVEQIRENRVLVLPVFVSHERYLGTL